MTAIFHFGVTRIEGPTEPTLLDDLWRHSRVASIANTLFEQEGDSFIAWGEHDEGDPLHVTCIIEGNTEDAGLSALVEDLRDLLASFIPTGCRLMDYVVATDVDDWETDVRVVARGLGVVTR